MRKLAAKNVTLLAILLQRRKVQVSSKFAATKNSLVSSNFSADKNGQVGIEKQKQ